MPTPQAANAGAFFFTLILIALIAGCTVSFSADSETDRIRICLGAEGYEWRDGDCILASK